MTQLTRSTLLVVLWWCGEPKINDAPSASWRPVQKALVKRVSRSETRTSGSPTSRNTDATKLRAAVSAVAVLKVGPHAPGQEVDVHLQEVMPRTGYWQLEEVEADAPPAARRDGEGKQQASGRQVVGLDALTRWAGPHVLLNRSRQAGPPHGATRQGERLVTTEVPAQRRCV